MTQEQEQEQEQVLKCLVGGEIVRRIDGRIDNGFLPTATLEWAIAKGYAEVFDNQGVEFVRITDWGDHEYKRERDFALYKLTKPRRKP